MLLILKSGNSTLNLAKVSQNNVVCFYWSHVCNSSAIGPVRPWEKYFNREQIHFKVADVVGCFWYIEVSIVSPLRIFKNHFQSMGPPLLLAAVL